MATNVKTQIDEGRVKEAETRQVGEFDRILVLVPNMENELVIRQGERESLVIDGCCPDLLARIKTEVRDGELRIRIAGSWTDLLKDALSTSLTREHIRYTLTVRQLTSLDVDGIMYIKAERLDTERLGLRVRGLGQVDFDSLSAQRLQVDVTGACQVNLRGNVVEQRVIVSGMAGYHAGDLESRKAFIRLNGPGQATVWATDDLEVTISGLGSVAYYGAPRLRQNVMPMGRVVSLGKG
jgi:hypothetical protein